ncbi:ROK family protein [Niameybacter massiliensis]|uniref:Glucokinase n=1 Tax=Holtiella tumoricola TaxID=3018743 RepID=A0AA42DS48_9FIRM|nr:MULTISPECIES: ROK family protein [Lachnospirales]MDA3734213.1 ROK family protein [Holtiella tumoricola]
MYYIGVDLGGTTIKVGLVNDEYQIIDKIVIPTGRERSSEAVLKDMADVCRQIMNKHGLTESDVHSIGIGSPGIASPVEGIIHYASNLNFNEVNVREEIQKYINLNVYVENDANCAALAEAICGAAKGEKDVVVVTLGTGVGGGIIIGGKVYSGAFCGGGEIGHHVLELNGRPCGCGRKGCWEQYASATALINDAKVAATANPGSLLATMVEGNLEGMTAKIVFDAAQAGDVVANEVLDQYFKYVAYGVANLAYMLQPGVVVLGGGMSAQGENLTVPVTKYAQAQMCPGLELRNPVRAAILGNDAGIIGAALVGTTLQ